jgi:hypothetical protein
MCIAKGKKNETIRTEICADKDCFSFCAKDPNKQKLYTLQNRFQYSGSLTLVGRSLGGK